MIAELFGLLLMGLSVFGLWGDINRLHTFTFQMLIYVELLDLLILRERGRFWNSKPSTFLLLTIAGDLILVLLIAILGLPGVMPISPSAALSVAGLSFIIVFLINDPLKVLLVRKFWI